MGACKQRLHVWGPVPPRAIRHSAAHTNTTRMRIDKHTHAHTPLCIHITVFVSTTASTRTPCVTCRCAIALALPCTISTRCNGWCDIPTERGADTGDHVQSVDLLHVGVTKQPCPEHGAHHHGRKHRVLVRCSYHLFWHFSPFRICGSEVHNAEGHAPIELVELVRHHELLGQNSRNRRSAECLHCAPLAHLLDSWRQSPRPCVRGYAAESFQAQTC